MEKHEKIKTLTVELLKEYFELKDGCFYRIKSFYHKSRVNKKLKIHHNKQYDKVSIFGKSYDLHRIIFLYHYGYLPENIDHIDGNIVNNDINNLRACTISQNAINRRKRPNLTSKYKGVSYIKKTGKWLACIRINGKSTYLGSFDNELDAHVKYVAIAKENHGEFVNLN